MPKTFVPPSLEDVTIYGSEIGLPEAECEKAFFFYAAKGWKVGKTPMKNWHMALSGWFVRWRESQNGHYINGADKIVLNDEYRRVLAKIESIKNGYESHREMLPDDRSKLDVMMKRRNELRGILRIVI